EGTERAPAARERARHDLPAHSLYDAGEGQFFGGEPAMERAAVDAKSACYLLDRAAARCKLQPDQFAHLVGRRRIAIRLIRRGLYCGPLVLNYGAIGGGAAGLNPADKIEFTRRTPDGAVLTIETLNRHIAPMCTMAIAMGLHVRVGIEDSLLGPKGTRETSVQQIERMVRIARELQREVATGKDARAIYQIGTQYQ